MAHKEDLTRDCRTLLTAKMASGACDGMIVTQSALKRIGMSRAYQERFLREGKPSWRSLRQPTSGVPI